MSDALDAARRGLAGERAWLVGGAVRDRLLGPPHERRRRRRRRGAGAGGAGGRARSRPRGVLRALGGVRLLAGGRPRQRLAGRPRAAARRELDADLALRDFTVNAIAEPLAGEGLIDPLGGAADLQAGVLRMAGPAAFASDPLRVLRLVRVAVELGMRPERDTESRAREHAEALATVSAERVFVELRRIVAAPAVRAGLELLDELGALAVVLPELEAPKGVEQNRFHHLDVYGHTLEVLDRTVALAAPDGIERARVLGLDEAAARQLGALLAEPLADELTRAQALRWGALLHDAAKPLTREVRAPDGRVTFIGHDVRGSELAREVLGRLRTSERLRAHVAALVRHHLDLGFLVHQPQPLSRQNRVRLPARLLAGRGRRDPALDRRPSRDARRSR